MLDGRVAIVTGGGRGIGREHCLELARHGAHVLVNDPGVGVHGEHAEERPADAVVGEVVAAGGTAIADHSSVTEWESCHAMVQRAVAELGGLDVVVNNAGIVRDRMITSMTEDDFDAVLAVHVKGTFSMTKHACDHWRAVAKAGGTSRGRIVNTTSGSGMYGNIGQSAYGAAKAAIANLTIVTALEMGRYGVTANAISPVAATRMTATAGAASDDAGAGTAWTRGTRRRWSRTSPPTRRGGSPARCSASRGTWCDGRAPGISSRASCDRHPASASTRASSSTGCDACTAPCRPASTRPPRSARRERERAGRSSDGRPGEERTPNGGAMTSARADALARFWTERIPFNQRCGFAVTRWDDDGVRMEVDETADHSNGAGSVHGGVIATLVDTVANAAAIPLDDFPPGSSVATVSITVNYVRPARGHLAATATCARRRGSVRSVAVDVHDGPGDLVAQGLVTVKVSVVAAPDPR